MAIAGAWLSAAARGEVRVQDVSRLQGLHTNTLTGFGLVVGLKSTGDGGQYANTVRALQQLHRRYEQPVLDPREMKANSNVAMVTVEVTIPQHGARIGERLDVVVSCIGPAKSLEGGQLLTTPLQDSMLMTPDILALGRGRIEIPDPKAPTRGVIKGGATLESDFVYNFIEDQHITLILDESHANFPMAQMVARAIEHELTSEENGGVLERDADGRIVVADNVAVATGPNQVRVRIPSFEMARPAAFMARVLETPIFTMPKQQARVVINRMTKDIAFTGVVTISPTVLQVRGLGTVSVGGGDEKSGGGGLLGVDSEKTGGVAFEQLLQTLSQIKASPEQMIAAVEQLHRAGTLHAQLVYAE
ncbi:MAG: flagellar basal body P-ring protein FlgI [Phycisphaerales bacterium]|nr:flagellar basal body P-ring protein FlgI [Phycisphaerales bacterium]